VPVVNSTVELDKIVLSALHAANRPCRPKDIWTVLASNGISYYKQGTPFPAVVAKSLYRLQWRGKLTKNEDGLYELYENPEMVK
jgi:hypothetical protein